MARPRRRTVLVGLAGVLGIWLLGVAWLLFDAKTSAADGRAELGVVRSGATPSSLVDPETTRSLDRAEADFAHARSRLRNPLVTPLRVLPVLGRHVRAGDHLVATAGGATRLAQAAVTDLQKLRDQPLTTGPERIAALDDLGEIIGRAELGVADLDAGSPNALVGPLGDAVADLDADQKQVVDGLGSAGRVVRAVRQVLGGPTQYLVVGANNAEMRAGSGMFLSASPVTFDNGTLELGEVRPTEQLVLPEGSVPVAGDLADNWSYIDSGRDFRSMALSADFPQTGPLAVANWALVDGGGPVGGVIVVDVDALRSLLRVVGPVTVGDVTYDADTVRGELLRKQYARFDDARDERRDQIGDVAREVFDRIQQGKFDFEKLATALIDASVRRNLLVWSSDANIQEAWGDAGVDGALSDSSLAMSLLNRGAEKLDAYVDTSASLTSAGSVDDGIRVTIKYRITNRAPAKGPKYVLGPNIDDMVAGEHRAIVVANLPAGATAIEMEGAQQILTGTDGPTAVVAGSLDLLRGESTVVTVKATLPTGLDRVIVEPSARIPRTQWTIEGRTFETDRRRSVDVGG